MRQAEERDRDAGQETASRWALLILRALVGDSPEFPLGGRRYRLSQEKAFCLEELDGHFVYYIRNAGTLTRRLEQIAAGTTDSRRRGIGGWAGPDG